MRLLAAALGVGLVLAQASDPLEEALQRLDGTQLQALAITGSFLEQQDLPAPWMKYSPLGGIRRLDDSMFQNFEACKQACPNIESVVKGLQQKMTTAAAKYQKDIQSLQQSMGNSPDIGSQIKAMKVMTPMIKDIMTLTFSDMCANKASYTCMVTNADKCQPPAGQAGGMGGLTSPASMSASYGSQLDCLCDACPGSLDAMVTYVTEMMGAVMSMLSAMGASMGGDGTPDESVANQLKTDLMKGICPMAALNRCFATFPTECASVMTSGASGLDLSKMNLDTGNMAELEAQCTSAGVDMEAAKSKVLTGFTIKGLDFAQVDANSTIKAAIIKMIKDQILAEVKSEKWLKGYTADDLTVTLEYDLDQPKGGSVVVDVEIATMPGSSSKALKTRLETKKDTIGNKVLADVKAMPEGHLNKILKEGTTVDQIGVTVAATTVEGGVDSSFSATTDGAHAVGAAAAVMLALISVVM